MSSPPLTLTPPTDRAPTAAERAQLLAHERLSVTRAEFDTASLACDATDMEDEEGLDEALRRMHRAAAAHREALNAALDADAAVLAELESDARALRVRASGGGSLQVRFEAQLAAVVEALPDDPHELVAVLRRVMAMFDRDVHYGGRVAVRSADEVPNLRSVEATVSGPLDPAHPVAQPCQGEHPHDVTITFGRRIVLRRLADGAPLGDLATPEHLQPLLEAELVGHNGRTWYLREAGRLYLQAHDEARTRRTPRPGPPAVPTPWRLLEGQGVWSYDGHLCSGRVTANGYGRWSWKLTSAPPLQLDAHHERASAELELTTYLRALRVYQSREAGDDASRSPSAVSGDTGRSGEPSHGAEQ